MSIKCSPFTAARLQAHTNEGCMVTTFRVSPGFPTPHPPLSPPPRSSQRCKEGPKASLPSQTAPLNRLPHLAETKHASMMAPLLPTKTTHRASNLHWLCNAALSQYNTSVRGCGCGCFWWGSGLALEMDPGVDQAPDDGRARGCAHSGWGKGSSLELWWCSRASGAAPAQRFRDRAGKGKKRRKERASESREYAWGPGCRATPHDAAGPARPAASGSALRVMPPVG